MDASAATYHRYLRELDLDAYRKLPGCVDLMQRHQPNENPSQVIFL